MLTTASCSWSDSARSASARPKKSPRIVSTTGPAPAAAASSRCADEGAADLLVRAEGVELLPLIDEQQQPIGARLLLEHAGGDVAQRDRAVGQVRRELVHLGQPVHLREVRLQRRQQRRREARQRPIGGDEGDDVPDEAALAAAQAGDQAGAHHRRLAAAGRADDGDERLAGERRRQRLGERVAAEEERLVLLAERAQAAVGADLGADGCDLLQGERPRRLPRMAAARISSAASSAAPADRSTQVLSLRNPSAGSAPESSTGITGKPGSRPCRSSARSRSRCCHGPRPSAPRKTATAPQEASVCSSACGHGCPAARYQRSRKTRMPRSVSARATCAPPPHGRAV